MGKSGDQNEDTTASQLIDEGGSSRSRLRSFVGVLIVVLAVAGVSAGVYMLTFPDNKPAVTSKQNTVDPGEDVVLPSGKKIDDLGGWQRVSPPENEPVFSYADKIGDVQIKVSQQKLPKEFSNNPQEKVEELAKGFNASSKIEAGNIIAYIGTNAKGPQSVILTKNDLLISIVSASTIDDADWSAYIKSLDSPKLENVPKF